MIFAAQQVFAFCIIGFYLYDCARLVKPNRLWFIRQRSAWAYKLPVPRWRIGSQSLQFYNPLLPWHMPVRARILPSVDGPAPAISRAFEKALRSLHFPVMGLAVSILLVLPMVILKFGLDFIFLLVLGIVYLTIIYAIWKLKQQAGALNLNQKQVVSMALECLFCPPFAVNLLRKIGDVQLEITHSIAFAERKLAKPEFQQWCATLRHYAVDQQQWYEPEQTEYKNWQTYLQAVQRKMK
jgi:hypothetical protein